MKHIKVEVYFAMYLTAIISFFAADQLYREEQKKLVATIESLVDLGDMFTMDPSAENETIKVIAELKPIYRIVNSDDDSTRITVTLYDGEEAIDTLPLVFAQNDTIQMATFSEGLIRGVGYTVRLRAENVGLTVTEAGKSHIISAISRSNVDGSALNQVQTNDLLTKIIANVEGKRHNDDKWSSEAITIASENTGGVGGGISGTSVPFVRGTEVKSVNARLDNLIFTAANLKGRDNQLQVKIGDQLAKVVKTTDESMVVALSGFLPKGRYPLTVTLNRQTVASGSAALIISDVVIVCEKCPEYDQDNLVAEVEMGTRAENLQWQLTRDGADFLNGTYNEGSKIKANALSIGSYALIVRDEQGSELARRQILVKSPPPPKINSVTYRNDEFIIKIRVFGTKNAVASIDSRGFDGTPSLYGSNDRGEYEYRAKAGGVGEGRLFRLTVKDKYGNQSDTYQQTFDIMR